MNHRPYTVALALLALATPACADELGEASDEDVAQAIEKRLQDAGLGVEVHSVRPAPIAGMQEVEVGGDGYFYVTDDGRYLLAGNLYELQDDDIVGITDQRRKAKRQALMADVPDSEMLIYSPESEPLAAVAVFTDTDCGFCRRLHTSMEEYHAHGIEVRYLAYPRAGVGSPTYEKMVSAWCANDPLEALTTLKLGEEIPAKSCVNPVAEQYALGQEVGLSGTPAIVLPDGELLNGLVGADDLAELLGL